MTIIILAIEACLISNVVLSQFLGICSFLGVSQKRDTAFGMGMALTFVLTLSSFVAGILDHLILVPLNVTYLRTIVFILVIAALVQFVEMFLKKYMHSLYEALGIYLPLITTNCAVLGVAIDNANNGYGILTGTVVGFATAAGYWIAIVILSNIREKMVYNDIPEPMKGFPIVMTTAALMSIAFFGFSAFK
ncbi:MAG: RnfABCDGE type electron transport complex subunit A [Eubacterium sp.]|nr:RnfABCDGE type electron transport complex subunit A [Eubacterium sp.]